MSVRKAHNSGRNHLRNVVDYYQRTTTSLSPLTSQPYLLQLATAPSDHNIFQQLIISLSL